jgi:hypothetical protein
LHRAFAGFLPAASPKALTSISRTIRRWTFHHCSDKSLQELAKMYNPYIQGWINYYGNFYRTQLRPTLKRIDLYVIRWAGRKFKRLRHQTKGARGWFARLVRANPKLFAHWQLCHGNGRIDRAAINHVTEAKILFGGGIGPRLPLSPTEKTSVGPPASERACPSRCRQAANVTRMGIFPCWPSRRKISGLPMARNPAELRAALTRCLI